MTVKNDPQNRGSSKFPFFPFFPFPLREGSFFHLMLQSNNKTTFSATGNPPPPPPPPPPPLCYTEKLFFRIGIYCYSGHTPGDDEIFSRHLHFRNPSGQWWGQFDEMDKFSFLVNFRAVQYSTVQYSTVQYSTVQYSTVQYSAVWPVDVINTKTGGRCQQFSNDVTFYLIDLSFDIPCVCYFMHTQARYFERYFQAMLRYVIGVPGWRHLSKIFTSHHLHAGVTNTQTGKAFKAVMDYIVAITAT